MLEKELKMLIRKVQAVQSESSTVEIKAARDGCPKVCETLSAFSNQPGGGVIVFGVDERDDFRVCGVYDAADLIKQVDAQCQQMMPVIRPLFTVIQLDGKAVVSAEIQEIDNADKPCFYSGVGRLKGSYIRSGDGDRLMTEYEVYSYEAFRKKIHDELRVSERALLSDLKTSDFTLYLDILRKKKPNLAGLTETELCRLQGFTDKEQPTLAGLMMFANYPQAFFPQLCVTAVSVPGREISSTGAVGERFIDNSKIDGTLPQMLEQALVFVRRNMKTATIIDPVTGRRNDRTEYPLIAVRELIINALVHRDYSMHTDSAPIMIRMFSDRFEIENPGGLYGRMTLDRLGMIAADTRNPSIANAMEILGETENRYSGIPTIRHAMEEYGLPEPVFESDRGIFKAVLYNEAAKAKESEIGNELGNVEKKLLEFCQTPRSRAEIEELFKDGMTIAYVMEKYVRPLIAKGLLCMTIPEKPKSKYQKYYSAH